VLVFLFHLMTSAFVGSMCSSRQKTRAYPVTWDRRDGESTNRLVRQRRPNRGTRTLGRSFSCAARHRPSFAHFRVGSSLGPHVSGRISWKILACSLLSLARRATQPKGAPLLGARVNLTVTVEGWDAFHCCLVGPSADPPLLPCRPRRRFPAQPQVASCHPLTAAPCGYMHGWKLTDPFCASACRYTFAHGTGKSDSPPQPFLLPPSPAWILTCVGVLSYWLLGPWARAPGCRCSAAVQLQEGYGTWPRAREREKSEKAAAEELVDALTWHWSGFSPRTKESPSPFCGTCMCRCAAGLGY